MTNITTFEELVIELEKIGCERFNDNHIHYFDAGCRVYIISYTDKKKMNNASDSYTLTFPFEGYIEGDNPQRLYEVIKSIKKFEE